MFLIDVFKLFLNLVYLPFKLLRTRRKITFISRQQNTTPLEFKMIVDSLKDCDIKMVTISRKIEKNFKSLLINFLLFFKEMYHISTSRMLIVDGYCILSSCLKHKSDLIIMQTWHANGIIKKIGLQTIPSRSKKEQTLALKMNMHKNYNYVLSSSKETSKVFKEAFGVRTPHILEIGTPMLDYLYNKEYVIKDGDKLFPRNGKLNVIYMPTIRKNSKLDMSDLINNFDFDKYNLYVKLHPIYKDEIHDERVKVIEGYSGEQVLSIADYVITDYSNIAFEAILCGVPVLFYLPDDDEYRRDPGLNIDILKEIPMYASKDVNEILSMLDDDYNHEVALTFANKYVSHFDGRCVKRIKKVILKKIR